MTGRKATASDAVEAEGAAPENVESVAPDAAAPDAAAADGAKDAEIARLREEAAESQRKLDAILAGQSIGEPAEVREGEVTVTMRIAISGLRDGAPWPAVGGDITVPAAEAEQLVALGYAAAAE